MASLAGDGRVGTAVAFCWLAAATSFTPLRIDAWASSCLQELANRGVLRGVGHLCVLSAFVVSLWLVAEVLARSFAALGLLAPPAKNRSAARAKPRRRQRQTQRRKDQRAAPQPRAAAPSVPVPHALDVLACLPLKRIPGAVEKAADVEMTQPAAQLVDALLGRFVADPSAGGSFLSLLQRVSSLQPAGGAPSKAAEPGAASDCGTAGGAAHPPQRLQIVRRVFRSGWQDVSAMLKPFISGESFLELQEVVVVDRAANVSSLHRPQRLPTAQLPQLACPQRYQIPPDSMPCAGRASPRVCVPRDGLQAAPHEAASPSRPGLRLGPRLDSRSLLPHDPLLDRCRWRFHECETAISAGCWSTRRA